MDSRNQISKVLKDPNRLAKSIYFSQPSLSPEIKRQVQVLIQEEYLKCTPLSTFLSNLMQQKLTSKSNGDSISYTPQSADPTHSCSSTSSNSTFTSTHFDQAKCTSSFSNEDPNINGAFGDTNVGAISPQSPEHQAYQLGELTRTIERLGIHGKDRPVYLAKKIFHESRFNTKNLQHHLDIIKREVIRTQYVAKPKKRSRGKRGRRGGIKNRKPIGKD